MMLGQVAELGKRDVRPRARETEKLRDLPPDVRAKVLGLGIAAAPIAEKHGGAGLGMITTVLLEEELAAADAAAPFATSGPHAFGYALAALGSDAQCSEHLAPFFASHPERTGAVAWGERGIATNAGFVTTATKKGDTFVIHGEKHFVVNAGRADVFVVFAQVDATAGWDGLSAFIVDKSAKGVSILPRQTTLGLDAVDFGGVKFEHVEVPASARLEAGGATGADFSRAVARFFARYGLVVAARSVGLARAAVEVTRNYCETRKAFGKPISHFQAVAFNVADRATDVDGARLLVWRAARAWDAFDAGESTTKPEDKDALLASGHAIAFAHEAAMRCGNDGVQLHGGAGFMRDYPVEKYMRDARMLGLCGMTAPCADQLAAAIELGAPALHLGSLLPTGESQNAFV